MALFLYLNFRYWSKNLGAASIYEGEIYTTFFVLRPGFGSQ
jgi:hypothetical protein